MSFIESIHEQHIAGRRVRVLCSHLASSIPKGASVLDVGCGDGKLAWLLGQQRPDLTLTGVEVLVRDDTPIPIRPFDGHSLPFDDNSFDVVSFVDVLHHCDQPMELLREANRVARKAVVIKDHCLSGLAAQTTLRLMDWVGNHRYGVALPYNYWHPDRWTRAFEELGLEIDDYHGRLGLYRWPLSVLFDRQLHFVARLTVADIPAPKTDDAKQQETRELQESGTPD